ncbi:MAG TPA: hypothetical protein VMW08_09265 [Acidimicrobiales bacterium]|nr:hypothetical protein [Acidimicrobiales bacterium]
MKDEALRQRGVTEVLAEVGADADGFLGFGGEAWVWAIDADRVVRVVRSLEPDAGRTVLRRYDLVAELARDGWRFPLPEAIESGEVAGRPFVIERRLPGRPMREVLGTLGRRDRDRLIADHLDATEIIGDLHLEARGYWGDLIADHPLRTDTWSEYLVGVAIRNLSVAPPEFADVDGTAIAEELPSCAMPSYVHLDAFAGNMLAEGPSISAVIDFGPMSIVGDRRLDVLAAAAYLRSDQITPEADEGDGLVAMAWLGDRDLVDFYEPARRWLAAYWSWASDDTKLNAWCREVLLG